MELLVFWMLLGMAIFSHSPAAGTVVLAPLVVMLLARRQPWIS